LNTTSNESITSFDDPPGWLADCLSLTGRQPAIPTITAIIADV
jgi:hypothetical protein